MNKNDCRDWFIMVAITGVLAAGLVFVFKYHEASNFAVFGTMASALVSSYHWANLRDCKVPDA